MIPYPQPPGYRHSKANEDRARSAARRQAAAARAALAVLSAHDIGPQLASTPVWRHHWIDVLRRRAADDVSTLRGLAAGMSPPMTKDAFAGQLRRACRFAAEVAAGTAAFQVRDTSPAARGPSGLDSADFCGSAVESRSSTEGFHVDSSTSCNE